LLVFIYLFTISLPIAPASSVAGVDDTTTYTCMYVPYVTSIRASKNNQFKEENKLLFSLTNCTKNIIKLHYREAIDWNCVITVRVGSPLESQLGNKNNLLLSVSCPKNSHPYNCNVEENWVVLPIWMFKSSAWPG
jgi:hypothetical protein